VQGGIDRGIVLDFGGSTAQPADHCLCSLVIESDPANHPDSWEAA
jgi:hypothetical protein